MQLIPSLEAARARTLTLRTAIDVQTPRWLPMAAQLTNSGLQFLVAATLAGYPWAVAVDQPYVVLGWTIFSGWNVWLVVLALHALWMWLAPGRPNLVPGANLWLLLGLSALQWFYVYLRAVGIILHRDYMILSSELYTASGDLGAVPPNLSDFTGTPINYFQNYFDPLVPVLVRMFDLTSDPARLLGFQSIALFSSAFVVAFIASRRAELRPFQVLLPVALLAHPSIIVTARADYHTSAIGISLLLAGTYLFFQRAQRGAFAALLVGTLTKISFWPSWLMFGVVHAYARRWRWAAAYFGLGLAAIAGYFVLGRFQTGGAHVFFRSLGTQPDEVATSLLARPDLWLPMALQPSRLAFFGELTAPLGLLGFLYPPALLPALPLVAFSLVDSSGFRTLVGNTYATEYLGFFTGAALFGLTRVRRALRGLAIVALSLGLITSFQASDWMTMAPVIVATLPDYQHQVAFSTCATSEGPTLAPAPAWASLARGRLDWIWFGEPKGIGDLRAPQASPEQLEAAEAHWNAFTLLVYPKAPDEAGSLTGLANADPAMSAKGFPFGPDRPWVTGFFELEHYQALAARLPVQVDVGRFRYHGDAHLALCAAQNGYTALDHAPP